MTAPLWQPRDPCGCVTGAGHTCRPPWMTEQEWAMRPLTPDPHGQEADDDRA